MASSALYQSSPLDRNEDNIRLLQFLPPVNGVLNFKFHTCSVEGETPFIALSYEWTPPSLCNRRRWIIVDGQSLTIGNNLWLALCRLAKSRDTGYKELQQAFTKTSKSADFPLLWVDAVCVDQGDQGERNHQVKLMKAIYSRATVVVAWLGPRADDSDIAIPHIREAGQTLKNPKDLRPLERLLSRSYWERLWIIQEFLLAPDVILYCGDDFFGWEDLYNTLFESLSLAGRYTPEADSEGGCFDVWNLPGTGVAEARHSFMYLQHKPCGSRHSSLRWTIARWEGQNCTDPRDKVFAILSLVSYPSPWHSETLFADYNKTIEEVYCDVLNTLTFPDLRNMKYYCFRLMKILGVEDSNAMVRNANREAISREEDMWKAIRIDRESRTALISTLPPADSAFLGLLRGDEDSYKDFSWSGVGDDKDIENSSRPWSQDSVFV